MVEADKDETETGSETLDFDIAKDETGSENLGLDIPNEETGSVVSDPKVGENDVILPVNDPIVHQQLISGEDSERQAENVDQTDTEHPDMETVMYHENIKITVKNDNFPADDANDHQGTIINDQEVNENENKLTNEGTQASNLADSNDNEKLGNLADSLGPSNDEHVNKTETIDESVSDPGIERDDEISNDKEIELVALSEAGFEIS